MSPEPQRHPCAASWTFPPARPPLAEPLRRTNLKELAARPDRYEHQLVVVGRASVAQLELVTASEPLAFAHVNLSDEYVVVMPTGDPMLDVFPFRVFLTDPATNEDAARLLHRAGELVLHPHGFLHWPGRLRPPFEAPVFAPGIRRAGVTIVCCAAEPTPPHAERLLEVAEGFEGDVKQYRDEPVPALLTRLDRARTVARLADACWDLVVEPDRIAPPRGGYVVVLEARAGSDHADADLVFVPAGASFGSAGVVRALVMHATETDAEPPPASWDAPPPPAFPPFEDRPAGTLPQAVGDLVVEPLDDERVRVRLGEATAEVPRFWMARLLFRLALHGFRLAYLETYGGFFYDDTPGVVPDDEARLGLRGAGFVTIPRTELPATIERLYRAVAPRGYTERLVP